jgi:nucleotide-binding universal stress UspA family protein
MAEATRISGVNASFEVRFGEIDREILNATEENKVNLIVAGTHGRRGFEHWLIGSVCERLLRRIQVPILTIGRIRRAGLRKIRGILVGVDFSAGSAEAVAWAFSIAEKLHAGVTLVHVADFVAGDVSAQYKQALLDGVHLEMKKLVPASWNSGNVTTRVEFGMPFRKILRLAEREKASMIVVGMHGKDMLERTLLGTTAEKVIRASPCPVLAVPSISENEATRRSKAAV